MRPTLTLLALLTATPFALAEDCSETGLDITAPPAFIENSPLHYMVQDGDSLQDTIFLAADCSPGMKVIHVLPGTYGPLFIQPSSFPDGLLIYAVEGAYDPVTGLPQTIIDGSLPAAFPGVQQGSAIEIDASLTCGPQGEVQIGWATTDDPLEGMGFYVTGGANTDFLSGGGGLRARDIDSPLAIKGNTFIGNTSFQTGGGLYFAFCVDVLMSTNLVTSNETGISGYQPLPSVIRGGGLYQLDGSLQMYGNQITNNSFGTVPFFILGEPDREGGGTAHSLSHGSLRACSNTIADNVASQGNGMWILVISEGITDTHVQLNQIERNISWIPEDLSIALEEGYRGGGIHMETFSVPALPYTAEVYNNRITENSVDNPGVAFGTGPDEVGGGGYFQTMISEPMDFVDISGNAAWRNTTFNAGGGFYVSTPDLAPMLRGELLFHHNTLAWNELQATGTGGGVFFLGDANFTASGNIAYNNTVIGASGNTVDWHAEAGVTSVFDFSQMTPYTGDGVDLSLGMSNGFADPVLEPLGPHLLLTDASGAFSPCINTAQPGLALCFTVDIDGHDRLIDFPGVGIPGLRDRGADEFVSFVRGDVNADGSVGLPDAVYLLNYLFSGGPPPPCEKAADIDDNGALEFIGDAFGLLNFLFPQAGTPPGPPPAAPYPDCGLDPTPDGLSYGSGTPCL